MRILIIDDHLEHGESLAELLTSHGHEAYFAPSALEAEWLFGLFRFDLSMIDFDMPDTTGAELARRLLARAPASDVVIMSAHGHGEIPIDVLGDLPFLPKPIEVASLLEFIDRLITRRRGAPIVLRAQYPLQRRQGSSED